MQTEFVCAGIVLKYEVTMCSDVGNTIRFHFRCFNADLGRNSIGSFDIITTYFRRVLFSRLRTVSDDVPEEFFILVERFIKSVDIDFT